MIESMKLKQNLQNKSYINKLKYFSSLGTEIDWKVDESIEEDNQKKLNVKNIK